MVKRSRNFDKRDSNELLSDVNGNRSYEADMTKDSRKGNKESKKTKKQWVKNGSETEESNDHFWERNEKCRKESEVCLQKNHVGSVIEKAWVKKKKKGENSGVSDIKWQQSLDYREGTNMTLECPNDSQNGTAAAGVGQGLDRIVAKSGQQTTKGTSKKSVRNSGCGAENMDELLTEQVRFEKSNQQGKSVETFVEGKSIEKEEKRKRKKGKSTVSEGEVHVLGHDLMDPKYKRQSNFNERDTNGLLTEITADAIAQSDAVTKDEKKRKKKSKKGEAESDDEGFKEKVTFSVKDEVFQLAEDSLVRGKRFSKEEDEMVKEAVFKYIETNFLGEDGLEMVLNSKSHPKVRNCWKEIRASVPHRPRISVYQRAQILFRRDEKRKWTKEQIEILREYKKKHGNHWRHVADELGKHKTHVASMWRYIKTANMKKGCWSQDEYQTLFDLVNLDLRMKYAEEKKSMHGMLRDNIPWTAISDRMTTRAPQRACDKWYEQLASPMVECGEWVDSDDYRLIDALFKLDAVCHEDVDWDSLIEHRSGTVCQKRWSEMVLHIGDNLKRSFADQVEVLAKRYCPELLEAKENWDSKPVVP